MFELLLRLLLLNWHARLLDASKDLTNIIPPDAHERNYQIINFEAETKDAFDILHTQISNTLSRQLIQTEGSTLTHSYLTPGQVYQLLRDRLNKSDDYGPANSPKFESLRIEVERRRGTSITKTAISKAVKATEGTRHIKLALELIQIVDKSIQYESSKDGSPVVHYLFNRPYLV